MLTSPSSSGSTCVPGVSESPGHTGVVYSSQGLTFPIVLPLCAEAPMGHLDPTHLELQAHLWEGRPPREDEQQPDPCTPRYPMVI